MRLSVHLIWMLATVGIGAGQNEGAAEELLTLKPLGTSFERSQGSTIMFTCEISNNKEDVDYSVRWFGDNNGEISDTSGRMYVEDDGLHLRKLYITKIEEADAGTYTCRARINGEQHERQTRLTIFKEITFDNAPSPQNPRIFSNALISCVVSGSPSPQVSWRFNGKRIDFGKASASRYALEQGKGMTIMNVTQDDDGEYICRAEVNVDGRYGEKKITVKVHIPPSITASPGKVSGVEGQSVTMKCEASGLPKPKYEFIKGKEVLQSTDRVVVDNDAGSVVFTKLVKSDEDQYTCRAINDVDQDTAVGHLHVFVKPEILELTNVTATEAGTATLVCKSRGDPTPDMTFHKVGEQSAYATGENEEGKIVVSQTESMLQLVISDLESTDTGSYVCSARNAHGHHEMTGTLTVNYAPKFVEGQLDEAYSWAGRSSNISCQANGSPAPSIEWLKGDQILSNNEVFHIFDLGTTSYLQITVRESDQSWVYTSYTCKAMNQLNFKEFNIDLKRATAPSSPASVNATKVSPTTAVLSVEQPVEDGGMPVVGYIVEIEGEGEAIDFPAGQPVKLTNLKPDTTYTVSVKAKNEVGASSPSELTFITESTRKPYPIVLTSDPRGAMPYNYKLSWELPDDGGTPIITYQIKLRQVDGLPGLTDWKTVAVEKTPKQAVVQHEFKDLKEQTTYEVEITAKNSIGWSDANDRFTFTTAKDPDATTITTTATTTTITTTTVLVLETIPDEPINVNSAHETLTGASEDESAAAESAAASVSFGTVIGVVAIVMVIALVIVDLSCFSVNKCGLTWSICGAVRGKKKSKAVQPNKDLEGGESEKMLQEQPIDLSPPSVESSKHLSDTESNEGQTLPDSTTKHGDEIPLRESYKQTDIDDDVVKLD